MGQLFLVGKIMWESMIGTIRMILGIFGLAGLPIWAVIVIPMIPIAIFIVFTILHRKRN